VSIAQLLDIHAENPKGQVLIACTPKEQSPHSDAALVKGVLAALRVVAGRRSRERALRPGGPAERQLMKEKVA